MKGKIDLTEWTYMFTYGISGDVYGYGDLRVMVERNTGEVIVSYVK